MDLGDSSISIDEDHKETDNVSLFKLSFIWSGLGFEEPLELTLVKRSVRFVVQLARLVEQVEQRDLHHEDVAEPPEVQHEAETGGNPEINSGDIENDDSGPVPLENNGQEGRLRAPINADETPGDPPRGTHESEGAPTPTSPQREESNEQHQGADDPDDETGTNTTRQGSIQNSPALNEDPTTQPTDVEYQVTEAEGTGPSPQGGEDNTVSNGQSPSTPTPKPQEDDYDEYAEGVNDLAPAQTFAQNGMSSAGWDVHDYEYEEDYDGADEEHDKRVLPGSAPNEPTDSSLTPPSSASKLQGQDSLQNVGLKRNLDELEYEEYETPSAPSSPVCNLYNPPLLHDLCTPIMPDETHANDDCDTPPREPTPELTDEGTSSAESADSESECSVSPTNSLFSDGPFEPNLRGPEPGEEAQFRGRVAQAVKAASTRQPQQPIEPPLVLPMGRAGGARANPPVAQAVPLGPADVPPNPPDQN
ncbi:hypothetical protein FRC11_007411 [Ceratobasidium sp. 423]|nr:hypothetical protein FRC11_007411 [Ceratobasidium sp. 423]